MSHSVIQNTEQDAALVERLTQLWLSEGKPGCVLDDGKQYQVSTPNGEDAPVFSTPGGPSIDEDGHTSTGFVRSAESKSVPQSTGKPVRKASG